MRAVFDRLMPAPIMRRRPWLRRPSLIELVRRLQPTSHGWSLIILAVAAFLILHMALGVLRGLHGQL